MKSKINLKEHKFWLLVIGLLLIGLPNLLKNAIVINSSIIDFAIGLGAAFALASLYFFFRHKNTTIN